MEVVMVFLLSCFAVASSSKCDVSAPLPKPPPMNTLKKISGTWYHTVSSNDYISAQYICGTLSKVNVNSDSGTFTALITKYYNKGKPRPFNVYGDRAADGYIERVKMDYREFPAIVPDQSGNVNPKALQEGYRIAIHPGENSLISDGTNYFAYVNCIPEGWAVWIYTPQKVLTTEDLLYVHNELVKNGINTELTLGKCEDINPE